MPTAAPTSDPNLAAEVAQAQSLITLGGSDGLVGGEQSTAPQSRQAELAELRAEMVRLKKLAEEQDGTMMARMKGLAGKPGRP
jgi:predicted membrane-bound spermidine synthase